MCFELWESDPPRVLEQTLCKTNSISVKFLFLNNTEKQIFPRCKTGKARSEE